MSEMIFQCVGGSPADPEGVCTEHGESACVIGVRVGVRLPSNLEADKPPATLAYLTSRTDDSSTSRATR